MARKKATPSGKQTTAGNAGAKPVFQFKITLIGSKPPVWRRIQVDDGTLDELHGHIQSAMGWTNSHLHQFEIGGEQYGDPELLDDGFDDFACLDSTDTLLSEIFPKSDKPFRFKYEYDFGDGWEHEILFEGRQAREAKTKYPLCVTGKRTCPPEDVGGVWGYQDLLAALADPKLPQDDERLEWLDDFDPEVFDSAAATKAMRAGLPDWRDVE